MAVLSAFSLPARLEDAHPESWNETVRDLFGRFTAKFPQFYDPTVDDTPATAKVAPIAWSAFPASLLQKATFQEGRWGRADTSPNRDAQDEYCEWSVERRESDGKLTSVTFTTELPEYWEHLAATDRPRLVELYKDLVSSKVDESDLFLEGAYNPLNKWNNPQEGRLVHLIQHDNALSAAVKLVAEATVLRERDGEPVKNKQDLVDCAGLGNAFRNSDPQVAAAVNDAAATGAEITFNDPVGLYIQGLETTGMTTPKENDDPADFWTIERGNAEHTLRARYAVPPGRKYVVGEIKIGGRPLHFGAQLADRVTVVVRAVVKPGDHDPLREPCKN